MIFDLELLDEHVVVGLMPEFDQDKKMMHVCETGPDFTVTHVRVRGTEERIPLWVPRTIRPGQTPGKILCFEPGSVYIGEPEPEVICKNCGAIQ